MSLSFVSSAVLSSSDGVSHNEEKEIESKELEAVRKNAGRTKSLFDQLRENQERDAEKEAEMKMAIMRGTLALDEEDVAHLDALNRSRLESERQRKTELDQELALFRAAKEERFIGQVVVDDEDDTLTEGKKEEVTTKLEIEAKSASAASIVPKVVAKRKRRKDGNSDRKTVSQKKPVVAKSDTNQGEENSGLGGLLEGYGSSSDEEND
jgi:hypothetical protein